MKKLGFILGFLLLTVFVNAQIKQNTDGFYTDADGSLFTGTLENNKDGIKAEIEIKNGVFNGIATYYYATGKIMEAGTFKDGQKDGKWLRYNEAGVTVGLAIFSQGKKNGTWLVWDDIGKKRFEMHYRMGEKIGTWLNWDEKGELISSKDFGQVN